MPTLVFLCHEYIPTLLQLAYGGVFLLNPELSPTIHYRSLLAYTSALRWVEFLYKLGPLRCTGTQINCVFQSFFEIGGILTLTLFLFMAFVHAFIALETVADYNMQ